MKSGTKTIGILFAIRGAYLNACCSLLVRLRMAGTYVKEATEGASLLKYTLTVTCVSEIGNVYEVSFKIDELQEKGNVEHIVHLHSERWTGFYDGSIRRLVSVNREKMIAFIAENRNIIYQGRQLRSESPGKIDMNN